MGFFERLKTAASAEWRAYTEHPFTEGLADSSLPEAAFRHYLVQDYLFLIEYAGAPYQEVAAKARTHLEGLAELYATPAREAELIAIFKEATRLEADFWEMGWRAGKR